MITPIPDKDIIVPNIMLSKPIAFLLGSQQSGIANIKIKKINQINSITVYLLFINNISAF